MAELLLVVVFVDDAALMVRMWMIMLMSKVVEEEVAGFWDIFVHLFVDKTLFDLMLARVTRFCCNIVQEMGLLDWDVIGEVEGIDGGDRDGEDDVEME